ncbi:FAD/NAD(P)-binding domain-containing protein [Penicillium paradoxum]|uniref:FAD/NAD(P)-binding domain-containing protein n=1 Tax=Penicillium paradoxum TaxID=176176 RepID=UPI00254685FD|nr:FAD/NAD(P)-binding domain-containing protein [Penicillium paradoxum]KAJ5788014.1 FAD/NAD(P)-binding domain-containing protein [Penicillium paradoxum]
MTQGEMPLRIIVVGAGIAGLTASLYLQRLGIDHIVLEKYADVAPPTGGAISMWPHGMRILSQIGCLDAIKLASVPYTRVLNCAPDGSLMQDSSLLHIVEENHGIGTYPLERRKFLQILYDALPDKSFIVTQAEVTDVLEFPDKVEVHLANGTVQTGDLVLGCDGVHSLIRSIMWDHADKKSPGLIKAEEQTSLETRYKTLLVNAPAFPELGVGNLIFSHGKGICCITVCQPDATYVFCIFTLDEPLTGLARQRYTTKDAEDLAQLASDKPIANGLVFSDIWKRRTRASVLSLEEGLLEHWHHDRICLVGDAVHKVQPNMALGGNAAIEGAASVINNIQRVLQMCRGPKPSSTSLNSAFSEYQKEQYQRMKELVGLCAMVAKIHTYATPWHRALSDWLLPLLGDKILPGLLSSFIANAPMMEFLPAADLPDGNFAWVHQGTCEAN